MSDRPREVSVFEPVRWAESVPLLLRGNGTPDTTAHHVLLVMATYADPDGTNIRPSLATLTKKSHLTKQRTTTDALRRLEDAKLIIRSGELTGGTVVWRLNYDLPIDVDTTAEEFAERRARELAKQAERQKRYRDKQRDAAQGHNASSRDASVERHAESDAAERRDANPLRDAPVERDVTPQRGVTDAPVRRDVTPQRPSQPQVTPATPALDLPLDLPLTVGEPPAGAAAPSAQPIVGAWIDAYTQATGRKPNKSMLGQVGKEARQLLAELADPTLVLDAAKSVGAKGFATLEREYSPMAARQRNGNGRTAGGKPWTNPVDQSVYDEGI